MTPSTPRPAAPPLPREPTKRQREAIKRLERAFAGMAQAGLVIYSIGTLAAYRRDDFDALSEGMDWNDAANVLNDAGTDLPVDDSEVFRDAGN